MIGYKLLHYTLILFALLNLKIINTCLFHGDIDDPLSHLYIHCSKRISAAGVVHCGGPKKSPRTSSILQIIFFFWSFDIREDILRNQNLSV